MYQKLQSIKRKENDINEIQRKKKVQKQLQQYNQNINYSDTNFFSTCEDALKSIANDAKAEQKIIEHKRKMRLIKQQSEQNQTQIDQMLLANILIDYCRSYQMNYTYSMIMKQKNITSQQVAMKSQMSQILDLNLQLQQQKRYNVSILELILRKIKKLQNKMKQKKQKSMQISIQCELLNSNSQTNNVLLTELKLQQIRRQVQIRQKKHYQNQIHLFKSQQLVRVKEDLSKLFEAKQQKITQKYEIKLKQLPQSFLSAEKDNKNLQKLSQYLTQIQSLQNQIRQYKLLNSKLEKQKLQHNCQNTKGVKNKLNQIQEERKLIKQKKYQFELALRNMDTKIQQLTAQKKKIFQSDKFQTQQFLSKMKQHKQNKDYMIEKVYGTVRGFQQRIQNLSKDNIKLLSQNQLLRRQISGLRKQLELSRQEDSKKRINLSQLKIPTKNALVGVTAQEISSQFDMDQNKSVAYSQESAMTYTSTQFEQKMKQKALHSQRINSLKLEMDLLKNKVKYLVFDFQ